MHRHQGSGSGRSESSKADSGYEGEVGNGGFEAQKYGRGGNNSKLRKYNTSVSENRVPYDNHAFTHDNEFEVRPTTDSYRGDETVRNHRTDRYNDYYSSQKSPKHIVSRDYDVGAHARQFQTIEQLDARSTYSHASVI